MHKQFTKILEIIQPALEMGLEVKLRVDDGKPVVDLDTMAKSHCYLVFEDYKILAKMRYGEIEEIESWSDVLSAVRSCEHGRDYFSGKWIQILEKEGRGFN